MIQVLFKRTHPEARLPERAHPEPLTGDTGYDVFSVEDATIPPKGYGVIPVGLTLAYLTPGYWFMVCTKSGLGFKKNLFCHPGIVDVSYRGDCAIKIYNLGEEEVILPKGSKIAQFVFYPLIEPVIGETDIIQETKRGAGGFGSTGT